jgi:hypothetical protein
VNWLINNGLMRGHTLFGRTGTGCLERSRRTTTRV